MRRILIVDDDEAEAHGLGTSLERAGFIVARSGVVPDPAIRIAAFQPHLVILDPDPNLGGDLLCMLRQRGHTVPIIVVSVHATAQDRLNGLRSGADDYVPKPFCIEELIERIGIWIRRTQSSRPAPFSMIEIFERSRCVKVRGVAVHLTPKEYALLTSLVRADGAVMSKLDLLKSAWNIDCPIKTTTVQCHVKQLRSKLRRFGLSHAIRTATRAGFWWDSENADVSWK